MINLRKGFLNIAIVLGIAFLASEAFAVGGSSSAGGGGWSLGLLLSRDSTSQDDMNTLQSRANIRDGGIGAGQLTSAYEGTLDLGYRISGTMYALHLRPSFFYEDSQSSSASGDYHYGVYGYSVFPIFRLYPLESSFIRFFMQGGLGYGGLYGTIQEKTASVSFNNSSFGSLFGLGSEFVISGGHTIVFEGNMRFLLIDRNISTGSTGTFASNSLSRYAVNQQVELDNFDVMTTMTGVQVMLGYAYYF